MIAPCVEVGQAELTAEALRVGVGALVPDERAEAEGRAVAVNVTRLPTASGHARPQRSAVSSVRLGMGAGGRGD